MRRVVGDLVAHRELGELGGALRRDQVRGLVDGAPRAVDVPQPADAGGQLVAAPRDPEALQVAGGGQAGGPGADHGEGVVGSRPGHDVGMRPMLATPASHVPAGDAWSHEVKWDGVRALTDVRDGTLRMTSRNENAITIAWPELATSPLGDRDLLVDGEIIALNERGLPDFRTLQERMHVRNATTAARLAEAVPGDLHGLRPAPPRRPRPHRRAAGDPPASCSPVSASTGRWQVPASVRRRRDALRRDPPAGARGHRQQAPRRPATGSGSAPRTGRSSPTGTAASYVVGGWRPQEGTSDRLAALLVGEPTRRRAALPWPGGQRDRAEAEPGAAAELVAAPRPRRQPVRRRGAARSTPAARTGWSRCWSWTSTPTAWGTPGCDSPRSKGVRTDLSAAEL